MIIESGKDLKMLHDYRDGKIQKGLGIEVPDIDRAIRYKKSQFNIILGHDNVGKTYWTMWYFLCLSSHHGITWTIWSGENKSWQIKRDLIQMYSGKYLSQLSYKEINKFEMIISQWFKFLDNSKLYTPEAIIEQFDQSKTDAAFIDPFTGLDRDFTHAGNYKFLNEMRQFVNATGKTVYMSTHPNSESGRQGMMYPKDHDHAGHLRPPYKDHVEGGKPFTNRVDDFLIIHRLIKHDMMRTITLLDVAKIKDAETGGSVTGLDCPIYCDFNNGMGFRCGHDEGIKRLPTKPTEPFSPSAMKPNEIF